jgi:hypothetical protein
MYGVKRSDIRDSLACVRQPTDLRVFAGSYCGHGVSGRHSTLKMTGTAH